MPPLPYRTRLNRQNTLPFNWTGDDGEALACRSGQPMTFARPSTDSVVTSTATVTVAQHQPAWADYPLGASHQVRPSDCAWGATWNAYVQPCWAYVAGYVSTQVGSGSAVTLLSIGDGSNPTFLLQVGYNTSGFFNTYGQYLDGSGNPVATLAGSASGIGVYMEFILQADAAYKMMVSKCISGGTPASSSLSSAGVAYPANTNWHGSVLRIADSANAAYFAYRHLIVGFGPAPTFAQIRTLAR